MAIIDSGLGWRCEESFLGDEAGRICFISGRGYYKVNNGIAIIAVNNAVGEYRAPMLISTIPDAVTLRADSGGPWTYVYTIQYLGLTWYYMCGNHGFYNGSINGSNFPIIDVGNQYEAEAGIRLLQAAGVELANKYEVHYNANGGEGVMPPQIIEYDVLTSLSLNTFTKDKFIFLGWAMSPQGNVVYADGEEVYNLTEPGGTVNLYAKWQPEKVMIDFYYNESDERQIIKDLISGISLDGVLRENCSIINPIIMFESEDVMRYNFCYIHQFQRYYFVREIENFRDNLWIIYLECDVLMSFKNDISNCKVVVDKQTMIENGDEYIDDGSLVADNYMFNTVYNFTGGGFNENPTYILITAG